MTAVPAPPPDIPAVVAPADDTSGAMPVRRVLWRQPGTFGDVFVVEEDGLILLRFGSADGADQSAIDPRAPRRIIFEYVRVAAIGPALRTDGRPFRRALVVGLGGGAYPRLLLDSDPRVHVDAIEIDPVVVEAAKRFFALPESPRLHIHVDDAAKFVVRPDVVTSRYDVIMLDAFSGDAMPDALSTKTFFEQLRRILTDDGILVVNVALVTDDAGDALIARVAEVFPACSWARARQEENQVLFAAKRPVSPEAIRKALGKASAAVGVDIGRDVDRVERCPGPTIEEPYLR